MARGFFGVASATPCHPGRTATELYCPAYRIYTITYATTQYASMSDAKGASKNIDDLPSTLANDLNLTKAEYKLEDDKLDIR